MRRLMSLVLLSLLLISRCILAQTECSPTSYYCLDPSGTSFNIVGPVNMWYSTAERACIASPHSHGDACFYVTQLCNRTYPDRCNGDCLPGDSVDYVLEKSCRRSTPISPSSSEPDVRHEIWFIKNSPAPTTTAPTIPRNINRWYLDRVGY